MSIELAHLKEVIPTEILLKRQCGAGKVDSDDALPHIPSLQPK